MPLIMLKQSLRIVLPFLLCWLPSGCGHPEPLIFPKNRTIVGPWCGPNRRVRIGQRVVGHAHDGDIWKNFLVDDAGTEYDPDRLADQAWSYLERTGDAARLENALGKDACPSSMTVVSVDPVVVILATYHDPGWLNQKRDFAFQRWYWRAQVSSVGEPTYRERLQWFSPELERASTDLPFSPNGVAEIPLARGKLVLRRDGQQIRTARE